MFRKMRRQKQELPKKDCIDILTNEPYVVDQSGKIRPAGTIVTNNPNSPYNQPYF